MKILVIHPEDSSTDFLKPIYQNLECTVVSDPRVSSSKLKKLIKESDKIIMLGHGTEQGMGDMIKGRFLIDSTMVYLLREKQNNLIGIWCNAIDFASKYGLKGLFTGMIISEADEALLYGIPYTYQELEDSNRMLANAMKIFIASEMKTRDIFEFNQNYPQNFNDITYFNHMNLEYFISHKVES